MAESDESMVQILQWTPFPAEWGPISEWQLQKAEYDLKLNKRHYYELGVRQSNVMFYPESVAAKIIDYWQNSWDFARYRTKAPAK